MGDSVDLEIHNLDLLTRVFREFSEKMQTDIVNVGARAGAAHLKKEVKRNIKSMGLMRTKNLWRNIVSRKKPRTVGTYIVSATKDAFYAPMIEYGVDVRKTRNGISRGKLPPKPFFRRAMNDRRGIQNAIIRSMSKKMIKDMAIISGSYGNITKTMRKKL